MYQWCNLNRPYWSTDLFFDTFWCNHPLGGVVFAFFIKVNAHDSPRNVFTFESSFNQMGNLSFDEHLFDTFLGCWVFWLQKFTPWGKVTEWENTTTSEQTESMCLKITGISCNFGQWQNFRQNFIVMYLDKVELMSVPGSLGKWICIVHDSIEHTIFKKWCSFFPLSWSWYNWNRDVISNNGPYNFTCMWLRFLPDVQSSKNTFVAFNDVVFLNIVCLKLSCWNGHTETNFQNFTALKYWFEKGYWV